MTDNTDASSYVLEKIKIALRMPGTGSYIDWAKELRDKYDKLLAENKALRSALEEVIEMARSQNSTSDQEDLDKLRAIEKRFRIPNPDFPDKTSSTKRKKEKK